MKFIELKNKTLQFLREDIWSTSSHQLPKAKSIIFRQIKIAIISYRGFISDKCQQKASALTFFTLLSIVPFLAMIFGVAKGFGFDKLLQKEIAEKFEGHQEIINYLIEFSNKMLQNTKGGLMAGVGVIILFWAVMKMLSNIELSFNQIWKIQKNRTWLRKFTDYLALMVFAPLLLILASSTSVYVSTTLKQLIIEGEMLHSISPFLFKIIEFSPYVLIWILFSLFYLVMPNTKVKFKSALLSGIIAGSMYQFMQYIYFKFQINVNSYNAIYGSFAALPLFLIWLQSSWLIVLLGAEISFAIQSVAKYEFEYEKFDITPFNKKVITLMICKLIVKRFIEGEKPLNINQISAHTEIPIQITSNIVETMVDCGLLLEVKTDDEQISAFQPSRDSSFYSIKNVMEAIDKKQKNEIEIPITEEFNLFAQRVNYFYQIIEESDKNTNISQIS